MKDKLFLFLCLSSLLTVSCTSEPVPQTQPDTERIEMTFSSNIENIEPDGKVSLFDNVKFSWNEGDRISICETIATTTPTGAVFTAQSSGTSVDFTGSAPALSNYYALYPFSALKNWKEDGTAAAYLTLPKNQLAIKDGVDPSAVILSAKSTAKAMTFAFRPAMALIKFTIDENSSQITEIIVDAPSQYLVGSASIRVSDSNPPINGYSSKTSSVSLKKADNSVFEPGNYYISVIPRTYTSLNFTFKTKSGATIIKSASNVALTLNKIYATPAVPDLVPSEHVETYTYSESLTPSAKYRVWVEGIEQFVYPTYVDPEIDPAVADRCHICTFGADKAVNVTVEAIGTTISSARVAPRAKGYVSSVSDNKVHFTLSPYDRVSVEINDIWEMNPLLLFVNPFETDKPDKSDKTVKYFDAGYYKETHNGINMTNNGIKTLYLEGGCVLKTNIAALNDSGITIAGKGIIDNVDCWVHAINIKNCTDVTIKDIILLSAQGGCTEFIESNRITCDNYKVVATYNKRQKVGLENDAFDFFGSDNATVTRCFAYAHDDLYAVDSKSYNKGWAGTVTRMDFDDCVGWNIRGGHICTIGYATSLDISNVTFKNMYSIHSNLHTAGGTMNIGAIGIHNGGFGKISNIRYENVHIENPSRRTFAVEMLKTPYDDFPEDVIWQPGIVENVTYKNIYVYDENPMNENSVIKGYDSDHKVTGVTFDNFVYVGQKATSLESAKVTATNYSEIAFK